MNIKSFLLMLLTIAVLLFGACKSNKSSKAYFANFKGIQIHRDFHNYFQNCGIDGTIVILDNQEQQWILSDTLDSKRETLPASTFKIINLLIALETQAIHDEHEVVMWRGYKDTVKYGNRPEIYRSMTIKEAFEISATWVFVELAKKIGRKNYEKYLNLCSYGNLNLSQEGYDFWNMGRFAISPINQVEFMRDLYEERLPFSKRNIDIVKKVMISESTKKYIIHSKTGWNRSNGINTGWWVGYLKNKKGVYFFATRLSQKGKEINGNFGQCRLEVTKAIFRSLKLLESTDK